MSHPCHKWYRIMFTNGKSHQVSGQLRDDLVAEMAERDCPLNNAAAANGPEWAAIRRLSLAALDTGGMCHQDEPWWSFKIDNLRFELAVSQCSYFLGHGRSLEQRFFASGRPYFKWHARFFCLVVNPRQHRSLLVQIERDLPAIEEAARVFFANLPTMGEVLREANASFHGVAPESLGEPHEFANSLSDQYAPPVRDAEA